MSGSIYSYLVPFFKPIMSGIPIHESEYEQL
jgi:hypothetical protein